MQIHNAPGKILVIAGPTASGKSALAQQIAQERGGVIINADSQQVYRELRILTARPTKEEEAALPHRLYGFLPASEPCSAGLWLAHARMEIDWALAQGKLPIVVGGTGLYIKGLMEGLSDIPAVPPEIRAQAQADLEALGGEAFRARLKEVDPVLGETLRPSDKQRLARAWEVWLATGKPLSWWQAQGKTPLYPPDRFEVIKMEMEREELYARCDVRVLRMLAQGAVEEVRALTALGLNPALPAMRIIGVPELSDYIRNEIHLEEATRRVQQATRNYAKRQLTWLRNQL